MKVNRDIFEKIGAFLSKEGAMTVARVLVGVTLAFAVGALGGAGSGVGSAVAWPAIIGISMGVVGLTAMAHTSIERQKKEVLLDNYREEISHVLGKNDKTLTVQDLEAAAKSPENPNGSTALSMALDYFRDTRNFFVASQAATAALMVTAVGFLKTAVLPVDFPIVGLASASGLLYNELFRTVTNVGSLAIDKNVKGALTKEMRAINQQIAQGSNISATRVMGVMVMVNPDLKKQIIGHYNQPYEELSIADKREVVERYDVQMNLVQTAKDINAGRMLPTELGFIAFGESSGTPMRSEAPENHEEKPKHVGHWQARVSEQAPEQAMEQAPTIH